MKQPRHHAALVSLTLAVLAAVGAAGAQTTPSAGPTPQVIATGLNGPMGILVGRDGSVWVTDSGVGGDRKIEVTNPETGEKAPGSIGNTARVLRIAPDGTQSVVTTLPSIAGGGSASGGNRLALLGTTLYVSAGAWNPDTAKDVGARPAGVAAVLRVENGKATEAVNTWDLESSKNPDGTLVDTHPYGIVAGLGRTLYIADAAGNDLLRYNPATGTLSVVAVFGGVPSQMPNPERGGRMEADPVPTGVVEGRDGYLYVSLLPGNFFIPGTSRVVRVTHDGKVSDFASGLTAATDIRMGPDGNLYVVQLGQFGQMGPVPGTGSVARITPDGHVSVALGGLTGPVSIDFNAAGDAYVVAGNNVLMYKGLAPRP